MDSKVLSPLGEWITVLQGLLDVQGTDIAEAAGVNSKNVSRLMYLTGEGIAPRTSKEIILSLIKGIRQLAEEQNVYLGASFDTAFLNVADYASEQQIIQSMEVKKMLDEQWKRKQQIKQLEKQIEDAARKEKRKVVIDPFGTLSRLPATTPKAEETENERSY